MAFTAGMSGDALSIEAMRVASHDCKVDAGPAAYARRMSKPARPVDLARHLQLGYCQGWGMARIR